MQPWERRLKDMAHLLENCQQTYFEPERFRLNTNQVLQTARTVTFIIQKNKESIPEFSSWYGDNVIKKWDLDLVMQWAKDARNAIEKEGDLDMHSSLCASLIFSYIESNDVVIDCGRNELVGFGVKKLVRYAQKKLPTGVADGAVVRIERSWVANTLSGWELLGALTYVYARIYACCKALASHMGGEIDKSIPEPADFNREYSSSRHIKYVALNGMRTFSQKFNTVTRSVGGNPPPAYIKAEKEFAELKSETPKTLSENVAVHSKRAKITFENYGYHLPMLFLYDESMRVIDFMSAQFNDTAEKYVFWRSVADRVLTLKPASLIFVSEAWLRDHSGYPHVAVRNMKITGEIVQISGIDKHGNTEATSWRVVRDSADSQPYLVAQDSLGDQPNTSRLNVFIPVENAFKKIYPNDFQKKSP